MGMGIGRRGVWFFVTFVYVRERDREESAFLSWKLGLGFSPSLCLSLSFV